MLLPGNTNTGQSDLNRTIWAAELKTTTECAFVSRVTNLVLRITVMSV